MATILTMSGKLAAPSLLKIKVFQKRDDDVIILDYDVTNNILSHFSNYIVDVVM